jgi:hypothetical protein
MSVLLDGLDELRKALHDMPDELTNAALAIVATAAEDTAAEVRTVYPTGPMRDQVVVSDRSEPYKARFVVESRAPQAHLWEWGTQNRYTQQGWNRGAAPAHKDHGLVSIAIRHRARMKAALIALVESAGFEITET